MANTRILLGPSVLILLTALAACGGSAGQPNVGADDTPNAQAVGAEGKDPGWSNTNAVLTAAPRPKATPIVHARRTPNAVKKTSSALSTKDVSGGFSSLISDEGQRELSWLDPGSSFYSHATFVDETTGTRQFDCSGFLDYALSYAAPDSLSGVPVSSWRPLASDWVGFFQSLGTASNGASPAWTQVQSAWDLQPGDVVAWLEPAGSGNSNTGHVMVVNDWPYDGRFAEWLVPVLDATENPHAGDSRASGGTGLGTGVIGLKIDGNGVPYGYWWRGGVSHTSHATTIALGRLQ